MDVKVIGQVDDKFISILTKDNFLMLLDQHAVDERIRLEKMIESKKYRNAKNFWEPNYSKKPTFEWSFSRILSNSSKARPTPKDAKFCTVYFSHETLVWPCLSSVSQSPRKRAFKSRFFAVF